VRIFSTLLVDNGLSPLSVVIISHLIPQLARRTTGSPSLNKFHICPSCIYIFLKAGFSRVRSKKSRSTYGTTRVALTDVVCELFTFPVFKPHYSIPYTQIFFSITMHFRWLKALYIRYNRRNFKFTLPFVGFNICKTVLLYFCSIIII